MLKKNWDGSVSVGTVQNCFRKAGFCKEVDTDVEEIVSEENTPPNERFDDDIISTSEPFAELEADNDDENDVFFGGN